MASITFTNVSKRYPDGTTAVEKLDLQIEDGEFVVLVGPSGCGKTTSLRMVAGLEEVTEGEMRIGDDVANELDPKQRDVAMVFQNYALYPHMSIYENIAFPLRSRHIDKRQIDERVKRAADLLGLEEHLKRRPKNLSGGQRQRVAMGRAIVREPRVFLMDEPLSNLDAQLRVQMRAEISRIQQQLNVTTLYVTHDQVEAMTMGDRIAVMRKGRLQQYGTPQTLYDSPANLFVAQFVGSPSMNLLRATVSVGDGRAALTLGERTMTLPDSVLARAPRLAGYDGQAVALGIRPEDAHEAGPEGGELVLPGRVRLVEALGHERIVHMTVEADPVRSETVLEIARDVDEAVAESLGQDAEDREAAMTARFDGRSHVNEGEIQPVALDPKQLHFFDLDSGDAL